MATSPSFPPNARACLDLAVAAAPSLVDHAIDAAVESLQQAERECQASAQRQELADAWLALLQRRVEWTQRYPALLRAAMESAPAEAPAAKAQGRGMPLALIDDDALVQSLEAARMTQLLAPRLEQPLAELNALMSSALGLATVQPDRNPLRPQVFSESLRILMQPEAQPHWPGLWTSHMAKPLAGEIAALYRRALELLENAHLQAASYRVLPIASVPAAVAPGQPGRPGTASAPANTGGAGGAGGGHAMGAGTGTGNGTGAGGSPAEAQPGGGHGPTLGGPTWADLSNYELGDELFQHFLFARSQPSSQGLAPAYYAQVDRELAAIAEHPDDAPAWDPQAAQEYRELPPVARPHRPVGTASALDEAAWGRWGAPRERSLVRTQLKKEARQVGQVLGLEVVRKLVDQVARDPRLLAPVREAIVAVEPALLRLALVAPRFFGQEEHAGRRLVERVAERSFKYNDEFAGEFHAFHAGVRSAFQALNEADVPDDSPFAGTLEKLEAQWAAQDELEAPARQVAVDAMYFAEARDAEAGQIAWTLSQRSDLEGVPAVVQDFLYGPWSLVMAHARLTDSRKQVDPGGWNSVISDLLWSVKREQTLREPARLIATIPKLLDRLRAGLALVGQELEDNATFFQALEKLHRPVLKLRAKHRHASDSMPAELEFDAALMDTSRQQPRRDRGEPWMARQELDNAGFLDTMPSEPAPLGDESQPMLLEPQAHDVAEPDGELHDGDLARMVDGLRQGCWVDLYSRRKWRRANLTWVSARATLFMFVSSGGRPHSMTRRSLERLLRERLLRPVDGGEVVPRALDQLSRQPARQQALAA